MKKALRWSLSIFRNPTCATFWVSSDLRTRRLFMPTTRLARRPPSFSQALRSVSAESSLIKTSK